MFSEFQVKKDICEVGRRIYNLGFVAANDGNISVRISDNEIWTTPTGVSKGFMSPDMLCKINMKGELLEGNLKPSSEAKMHIRVYKERLDVKSVVHAHPPTATGFAVAGIPLEKYTMPEAIISLGSVPIAEYGTPSTEEIPDAISKYLPDFDALLLENHGALTYGHDLFNAYFKMETIELYAKISLTARQLGGEKEISPKNIMKLMEVRKKMNIQGKHPGCSKCTKEECTCRNKNADSDDFDSMEEDEQAALICNITQRVLAGK